MQSCPISSTYFFSLFQADSLREQENNQPRDIALIYLQILKANMKESVATTREKFYLKYNTSATISLILLPLFAFLNWSARSFACFSASVCRFSLVNASCICSARAFSSLRAADNSSIVSRSLSVVKKKKNSNTNVKFWSSFRKRQTCPQATTIDRLCRNMRKNHNHNTYRISVRTLTPPFNVGKRWNFNLRWMKVFCQHHTGVTGKAKMLIEWIFFQL